ncbi:hypothetical protein H6P81_001874 [Aristolochia fimbriata]|uniref:Myb/SANT-like DNA-binding domain-containing protein n=1 Tax=Aristolochia fimbriata TaxID=158543 RepID=A0AAV7FBZ2_ARIFI|nr:hypothetical protein H6P81_001874 [Aristolochia fimbriata]
MEKRGSALSELQAEPSSSTKADYCNLQRLKRDEWSEGAVSSLLDAYESKWALRNRAKLKGHDWEDVARHVSARANSTKVSKTSTQCKNKIESMKKRYRSEVAAPDPTSWPLFPRLDLMLRGGGAAGTATGAAAATASQPPQAQQPLMLLDPPPPPILHEFNGGTTAQQEEAADHETTHNLVKEKEEDLKVAPESTESSTPEYDGHRETSNAYKIEKKNEKKKMKKKKKKTEVSKKKQAEELEVAESVRWLAEVMLRSEQARMETMKELERIRAETETQKAEMDLKRTEIMANTQLQIARILAGKEEAIDSSLRIGRS